MSDYIVPRSVSRLEEEIAELERQAAPPQTSQDTEEEVEDEQAVEETEQEQEELEVEDTAAPLSEEEATFKKRYADLRRHSQKLADDLKKAQDQISSLSKQKTSPGLPTAEEAENWAKQNPKAAAIIRAIAIGETSPTVDEVAEIKERLNRTEQQNRIIKVHPDFEDITSQDSFHDWAESQPQSVQNLIYSKSADDVIWAISFYKEKQKTGKSTANREAAKSVAPKTTTVSPTDKQERRFRESEVEQMTASEYEGLEKEIEKAIRSGNFVYDLSGAAR